MVYKIVRPRQVLWPIVIEVAKNLMMSVPPISRARAKAGRTALPAESGQLYRYVFDLVGKVRQYCGDVKGKHVLEIGPGDHLAAGLAFMALGAASYTAMDRFVGQYDSDTARAWYRLVKAHWPYGSFPEGIDVDRFPHVPGVLCVGSSVERATLERQFDIVCSFAVGEHISDLKEFARLNKALLADDGVAMHLVDFGGHRWDRFGDPFLFLKFPDWLWALMGSARGEQNRVRFAPFVRFFTDEGLSVQTHLVSKFQCDLSDSWVAQRLDHSFEVQAAAIVATHACAN